MEKLIVGYDGSDRARDGLALAALLARTEGVKIVLAHVIGSGLPLASDWRQYEQLLREDSERMLAEAPRPDRVEVETRVVVSTSPARGLHELAETEHADALVLGSSHRGAIGRVLVGAVALRLLHGAPCPVAVAPRGFAERTEPRLDELGVAFDGSDEARAALAFAARLASSAQATLTMIAVAEPEIIGWGSLPPAFDPGELAQAQRQQLERELANAVEGLPAGVDAHHELLEGDAAAKLVERAAKGIDLLVTGSRAYGPVRTVVLGSVAASLVERAPCPVIVVPRTAAAEG